MSTVHAASTPSRRTLAKGAAWATPVLTAAALAPSVAASKEPLRTIVPLSAPFDVARCSTITGVTFEARDDQGPAAVGGRVTVTLPPGLVFTSGGQAAVVTVATGGVVGVPPFRALGAAGSYAISATYGDATATSSGTVTPPPGAVTEFRGTFTGSGNPTTSVASVSGITAGTVGAVSGDNKNHRNGAIVENGRVRLWGNNGNGTAAAPTTLQVSGSPLTGITAVGTFTLDGSSDVTGGIAAGANGASIYQWYGSSTTTAPTVRTVTGVTGTVVQVEAHNGYCYVLTTAGVYFWATATSGTAAITASGPIAGTAGASVMSTYAPTAGSTAVHGGAVVLEGQLKSWTITGTATGRAANVTGDGANSVASVVATSAGLLALTTNGEMYTQGPAFNNAGTPGRTAWTRRATGVSQISAWGVGSYFGGTYISQGVVHQTFAFTANAYTDKLVGDMGGKSFVQTYAADGTYMALASDGTVYYWYKNNDTLGSANPKATALQGVRNAVDLNVWAYHADTNFYGGGYVITAGACT